MLPALNRTNGGSIPSRRTLHINMALSSNGKIPVLYSGDAGSIPVGASLTTQQLLQPSFSGRTSRCQREDAGSIPVGCICVKLLFGVASEWDLSVAVTHVPSGQAVRFRTAPFEI